MSPLEQAVARQRAAQGAGPPSHALDAINEFAAIARNTGHYPAIADEPWAAQARATERDARGLARAEDEVDRPVIPTPGAVRMMERARIKIGIDLSRVVDEALLAVSDLGEVYVRARRLVHVATDRGADFLARPEGSLVILPVKTGHLVELLGRACNFTRLDSHGEWRPAPVPPDVTRAIEGRDEWPMLPQLEGVVDAPLLRPDGTVLATPGYDRATGLIYRPGDEYPAVPEAPTLDDARAALDALLDPISEFTFGAPCDRSAALALILTLVARPAIPDVTPAFCVGAPTPGAGKGLLTDVAAIIATGRMVPKMSPSCGEEEWRKRLFAIALEGAPMVCIDNVEDSIGGATLASTITAGVISDRRLGVSEQPTASFRSVVVLTGNNVSLVGDLGRRVIPIELDPRCENPEDRQFRRRDLRSYVRSRRAELYVAALTILRAYAVAGRPDHGLAPKGSFEAWDGLVRGAMMWLGEPDPLAGTERIRAQGDGDRDSLRAVLHSWREVFGDRAVTCAEAVDAAVPRSGTEAERVTRVTLRAALESVCPKGLDARALGYALRKRKGRIADGLHIVPAGEHRSSKASLWRVEPAG